MSKRILVTLAAAVLVGIIAVVTPGIWRGSAGRGAIALTEDIHLRCSAYFQTTADILTRGGDAEIAHQYQDRAALALGDGSALSGQKLLAMTQARNAMSASMKGPDSADEDILGDLASRYDDECISLLNEK